MPFSTDLVETIRRKLKLNTRTPPWSVISFALCNENGGIGAYVDKTTGLLFNGAGVAMASSLTNQIVYSASGAISVATQTAVITKTGSLAAMTLAAPTTAQNGLRITATSTTAFAHTITATSLINDGATGVPHTTATFAAFAGASITMEAYSGKWNVISSNNVTIS